jgi:hypothetical protein
MKNKIFLPILSIIFLSILATGCLKQEEIRPAPTISFKTGGNYISGNYMAYSGERVLVGLECKWNGTDPMKSLILYSNGNAIDGVNIADTSSRDMVFDTIKLIKSDAETENWVFLITDSQGASSYIGFTLSLSTLGGQIVKTTATIGLQDNTTNFSYYSLSNGMAYNNSSVENGSIQNKIDVLGAYDATNGVNLISPNSPNLPEPYLTDMADWNVKNDTKFCLTDLVPAQFDYINLDNLIISSFSTNPNDQKNKAKNLKADDIYAFKIADGRYGLLKVNSVTSGVDGNVKVDIKMQQSTIK